MTGQDRAFKLFLRVVGTASLLATFAVVMPYSWMNGVHEWLGMGRLPSEPVVGYLARSTSAFYALLGGLLWVVSSDLHRHRLILRYLGVAVILFGAVLLTVDIAEGMPFYWTFSEGPIDIFFGIIILFFSCRLGAESEQYRRKEQE